MGSYNSNVNVNVTTVVREYFPLHLLSPSKYLCQYVLIHMIAAFDKHVRFGTPKDTNAADAFEGFLQ